MEVKDIRLSIGMTRKQFSEFFGMSVQLLSNWENGYRKPVSYVPQMLADKVTLLSTRQDTNLDKDIDAEVICAVAEHEAEYIALAKICERVIPYIWAETQRAVELRKTVDDNNTFYTMSVNASEKLQNANTILRYLGEYEPESPAVEKLLDEIDDLMHSKSADFSGETPAVSKEKFPSYLKAMRGSYTQRDFADMLGIERITYQNWELSKALPAPYIMTIISDKIAKGLAKPNSNIGQLIPYMTEQDAEAVINAFDIAIDTGLGAWRFAIDRIMKEGFLPVMSDFEGNNAWHWVLPEKIGMISKLHRELIAIRAMIAERAWHYDDWEADTDTKISAILDKIQAENDKTRKIFTSLSEQFSEKDIQEYIAYIIAKTDEVSPT